MGKLNYVNEHITCLHYSSERECSFQYSELLATQRLEWNYSNNLLVFVLEGSVNITHDYFIKREFRKDDIILISIINRESELIANEDSIILSCAFDVPLNSCDKLIFSKCVLEEGEIYDFKPIAINEPMRMYLDTLVMCLKEHINCSHFQELKAKEMFFFFKYFYNKEQLALLFHPLSIDGRSLEFRKIIFENFRIVKKVDELAEIVGMSRSRFDARFRVEFSMSPAKWMQMQMAKSIKYRASEPGMTVSKLMEIFDFDFPSSFTRFCKDQFGCSPTELIQGEHPLVNV